MNTSKFMVVEGGKLVHKHLSKDHKAKEWTEACSMNLSFMLRDWDALSAKHKKAVLNEVIDNLASIAQLVEQAVDNR